jgi:hypothetical protein
MLKALISTVTELLDSKKAAYSFIAALGASVLHLCFGVSVQDALLLVSPLGVATISQAHVDAAAAKSGNGNTTTATEPAAPAAPTAPVAPAAPEAVPVKTEG